MADSTDYRRWVERIKQDLKLLGVIYNEGLEGMEDSFCYICHQADGRTVEEARDAYVCLGQLEKEIKPFLNWC